MTFRLRVQCVLADLLTRLGLSELAYDVATFAPNGIVCHSCGKVSHTEREHLTHHKARS
jgi:hypothetical protein